MDTPETQVASVAAPVITPEPTPEAVAAPVSSDGLNLLPNILGELRAARARIGAGATPINLAIPGYNGRLVARFRWVPAERLAATSKSIAAIKNPTRQQLAAAADALVACNDEILVNVDGKLESLQHQGEPVTFSNGVGLCVALGLPAPTNARDVVFAVIGNDYALSEMTFRLMTWLEDTTREVAEEHLGE